MYALTANVRRLVPPGLTAVPHARSGSQTLPAPVTPAPVSQAPGSRPLPAAHAFGSRLPASHPPGSQPLQLLPTGVPASAAAFGRFHRPGELWSSPAAHLLTIICECVVYCLSTCVRCVCGLVRTVGPESVGILSGRLSLALPRFSWQTKDSRPSFCTVGVARFLFLEGNSGVLIVPI